MKLETQIATALQNALKHLYNIDIEADANLVQPTRKGFTGDLTVVVFPWVKVARKSPDALGAEIGQQLLENLDCIQEFNVVKGYLNLQIKENFWMDLLEQESDNEGYGLNPTQEEAPVLIEYSSPNTNKPLHLGHIRNNLLGHSVSQILKACGHPVVQVNLVNDRGIHICKSMLAWLKYGNGETPESSGMKGDHLVGKYYVVFDKHYKQEQKELVEQGLTEDEAKDKAPLILEAREMLRKWEAGDKEVRELWAKMNGWVYAGFDETYAALGITFDQVDHESETYLLGKELVQKGLDEGVFIREADGSVWCDLTADGLDRKLVLRGDGTSVYITQDLGTAERRFTRFDLDSHVYVVGNEQDYHFQVLKLILKKLGFDWADQIYHLSYGMVELPEGKMKSREGTVVDADDLIQSMYEEAKKTSEESGKLADISEEEKERLYRMIGLGALKYFIIKVDPKKTMLFNPKESIDFNGNTGPFIQYTHARICSILRKATVEFGPADITTDLVPSAKEIRLIKLLGTFPGKVAEAGAALSPAVLANYAYDLAKEFNQYYHDTPILREENQGILKFRLELISVMARTLRCAMGILGIELPERM